MKVGASHSERQASRVAHALAMPLLLSPLWVAVANDELSACKTGDLGDLRTAMKAHNDHVYRMNRKFKDVWYFQGTVPVSVKDEVTFDGLHRYLEQLAPRKVAVLFHATDADRLCTWLITANRRPIIQHLQRLPREGLEGLNPSEWMDLGMRTARRPRVSEPGAPYERLDAQESKRRWDALLRRVSGILLPPPVAQRLIEEQTDTLIVVPISIRSFRYPIEREEDSATEVRSEKRLRELPPTMQLVLAVGTVPFLALPLGDAQLVDRMSVVVAPGFFPFAGEPLLAHDGIRAPLVVGAPIKRGLEPLTGAQAEAEQIARELKTTAYVGKAALKGRVLDELVRGADTLDFILFATHGRASEKNPVDESFLEFSDGRLNAREISRLRPESATGPPVATDRRFKQRPTVVMSACETGLGKDFAVGTIGLARAWQWAGASNVVMSLWSVDDEATRDFMIDLVGRLREGRATDRAVKEAAINARLLNNNPAFWAAFSVFGAPERLRTN